MVPVVGRFDLDQPFAAGEATGDPHRIQRRLRPAVGEPPLRQPEALRQLLGDYRNLRDRLREMRAPGDALGDRLHDQRVGVADDHDAEAVVEVDVLVAVDVPDPAAAAVLDEDGLRGGVLERRGHTPRAERAGLAPELVGPPPRGAEPVFLARNQIDSFRVYLNRRHLVCHHPGIVPGPDQIKSEPNLPPGADQVRLKSPPPGGRARG